MMPLVIGFGYLLSGGGAVGAAFVTAAKILTPLLLAKENKEYEANDKVGVSKAWEGHLEAVGASSSELQSFQFQVHMLPESMHFLLSQKWILTKEERLHLFSMVRQEMLLRGEGPYAAQMASLCATYGVPYEELAYHASLLGSSPNAEGDYSKLRWLSNNRINDPRFSKLSLH